jgi:hypothetical protein
MKLEPMELAFLVTNGLAVLRHLRAHQFISFMT